MKNVVGYNNKDKNVFNSIKDVYIGSRGEKINFLKDPEKLLHSYSNLIRSLGRKYGRHDLTYDEQRELYAYISETFLDLVLEFDMENEMDFPGYIARMLEVRIRGSYLYSMQNYKNHIAPLKNGNSTVEYLLDQKYDQAEYAVSYGKNENKDGDREVIAKMVSTGKRNEIDDSLIEITESIKRTSLHSDILCDMIDKIAYEGYSLKEASKYIQNEYNFTPQQFKNLVNELKKYLKD